VAVVYGEPQPWAPAVVEHRDAAGQVAHSWNFDRGLARDPVWSADGTRLVAAETERGAPARLLALNASDGSTAKLGSEVEATALPQGVALARGGRLVARGRGDETLLADHPGACIDAPRASPDAAMVAYAAVSEREMDLWVARSDGSGTELLFNARPSAVSLHWSPDSSHVYAVLAGDWDWQVWELAVDGRAPKALVREAAAVTALAPSPSGAQIAIVASAALDFAQDRREVFVIDRQTGGAVRHNLSGRDAHSVAWLDDQTLLVVVSDPTYEVVPEHRELKKLLLADGSLADYP
jgi:Tol biopolymer transport system component